MKRREERFNDIWGNASLGFPKKNIFDAPHFELLLLLLIGWLLINSPLGGGKGGKRGEIDGFAGILLPPQPIFLAEVKEPTCQRRPHRLFPHIYTREEKKKPSQLIFVFLARVGNVCNMWVKKVALSIPYRFELCRLLNLFGILIVMQIEMSASESVKLKM